MSDQFINLTLDNLEQEHLCCAIADKKHQLGVLAKKQWLRDRIKEGHVFRKLNVQGKVFIEYAPLELAWIPIQGEHFIYIYCLWVAGSFKGQGYGKALLEYCIADAKAQGKSGICTLSSRKKKPFLSDKKFLLKYGFKVVDTVNDEYELLALSFDGTVPAFRTCAKQLKIQNPQLTIYYGLQCPYIVDCITQLKDYCNTNQIPLELIAIDSLAKAQNVPCIFNNWAVFYQGQFATLQLLNVNSLQKLLNL